MGVPYVDLYLGNDGVAAVEPAQEVIARLGADGWEPVGQVDFRCCGGTVVVRQIMFKRPLEMVA